ncbi:MAG: RteC domain-containing protein [Bacteroidales bacterium]|uniref:RteC domain-containing protein n=1 Tax=Lascolabacillus sp. TaxID=1924068 RepID=UPI002583EDEC|nr:RteC domain-containing protein [Lascolabacillus sp.]MDD2287417.1 RteC domain-containing protein [Bacteroidales bacterium]MDD3724463.1 RteC domain-containing protein [Bacteroidales bacterium]MDD4759013.1 RteC domain-containing protein [Lascolabacillus sp.]
MKNYTQELIEDINANLQNIVLEENDVFFKATQAVNILENAFNSLKSYISSYTFKDESEEIAFFKEIKPQLFSKLIYYRKIYSIEVMRSSGSFETQKNYLNNELDRIKGYFERNLDLYKYYRTGCNHLDRFYFMRGKPDIQLNLDSFYFERDPVFSTSFDFKIAKILSNEMLVIYLNEELAKLESYPISFQQEVNLPKVKMTWTAKKTELVEQLYSWDTAKCFNNGNTNIKELAEYIETAFNINLGDYYHTFLEMRERKGSRTQFLEKLIKFLNDRMDNLDNK